MKLLSLLLLIAVYGYSQLPELYPVSEDDLNALESACERVIHIQKTANNGGQIEARNITYGEQKGEDGACVIWFVAAAMKQFRYIGHSQAPWMRVTLLNNHGDTLWESKTAWLVEVSAKGGYEFHFHRVPAKYRGEVYDVRIEMSGANGSGGSSSSIKFRKNTVAAIAKAIRAGQDPDKAGLTADEKTVVEFVRGAWLGTHNP